MKTYNRIKIFTLSILLAGITALPGCTGSGEDVRVTLCKNLATAMLESSGTLVWKEGENEIHRPEYAVTKVRFELPDQTTGQAACFYLYNKVDENVITHANPLSAYTTVPYKMILNGKSVPGDLLLKAVNAEQVKLGKKILDEIGKGVGEVTKKVKDGTVR
jgi:hypothetical protein